MPLYAVGSNSSGQLGLAHYDDVAVPARCVFDAGNAGAVDDRDLPVHIAAGGNHTLVLFASGAVYAAGAGTALAWPSSSPVFRRVVLRENPADEAAPPIDCFQLVAASWEASYFVPAPAAGRRHAVYVVGSGHAGELGLGEQVTATATADAAKSAPTTAEPAGVPVIPIPAFPPPGTTVVSLAASLGHVVALLSSGEVYGWGRARKGQLGPTATQSIIWSPRRIMDIGGTGSSLSRATATAVACGREFTAVARCRCRCRQVTELLAALDAKTASPDSAVPVAVDDIAVLGPDRWGLVSHRPAAYCAAAAASSAHGSQSGQAQALDESTHSAFPPCPTSPHRHRPHALRSLQASWHGIYAHAADGTVTAWGRNDHGQLPPPALRPAPWPAEKPNDGHGHKDIVGPLGSANDTSAHHHALQAKGVQVPGTQLQEQEQAQTQKQRPVTLMLAVGSEHALALVTRGHAPGCYCGTTQAETDAVVVAFGWGEHGNCGPTPGAAGVKRGAADQGDKVERKTGAEAEAKTQPASPVPGATLVWPLQLDGESGVEEEDVVKRDRGGQGERELGSNAQTQSQTTSLGREMPEKGAKRDRDEGEDEVVVGLGAGCATSWIMTARRRRGGRCGGGGASG